MKHQESHITAHQYPMAMNRELLFRQHCLKQRMQYGNYPFKLDSVYLKTKTIWRITGNVNEFNTRLRSQFTFVFISIFQDLFERSKFSRLNCSLFCCWKINSLCSTHNRIAIWNVMQRFICHFVTAFSTICRDSMMKLPFVVALMTHVLKKWQLKCRCRKTVHSFANVCPDVSKSAMILKFQWRHCFSKHHCWRKKGLPDRMCPSCIFSTKITISEARRRTNLLDSRNFYVNIFSQTIKRSIRFRATELMHDIFVNLNWQQIQEDFLEFLWASVYSVLWKCSIFSPFGRIAIMWPPQIDVVKHSIVYSEELKI